MSDINVLLKRIHHTAVLKKTSLMGAEWCPFPSPDWPTSGELEALLLCKKACFPSPQLEPAL